MSPTVILTDEQGNELGQADKLKAHTGSGMLHKAFSVYVFRKQKTEILLQQRSDQKMLWPLFWTNTCCSHPEKHETPVQAGTRRLQEEMGFTTPLKEGPSYVYRAEDPSGAGVEHEFVTTLVGECDESINIQPDSNEVANWKWMPVQALLKDFADHPETYTPWFPLGLEHILRTHHDE